MFKHAGLTGLGFGYAGSGYAYV